METEVESSNRVQRRIVGWVLGALVVVGAISFLLPPVQSGREQPRFEQCKDTLRQIGLALQAYHGKHGSFPPAYGVNEEGRPIHSWRTLLLPLLGHPIKGYRFDEPWDGEVNSELDATVGGWGALVCCPSNGDFRSGKTSYLAVVGENAAWSGSRPLNREKDFPDGLANTILVVEVKNTGIRWMEPRDLNFDEMSFTLNDVGSPSISGLHYEKSKWPWRDGRYVVNALFADGSVRSLPLDTPPETIRALLTRNGGEKVAVPE